MHSEDHRMPYEAPVLTAQGSLLDMTLGGSADDKSDNGNQKRVAGVGST